MKIGIMTFWESKNNYGQILQLFALQRYLKSVGHEAYLIRFYRRDNSSRLTKLLRKGVLGILKSKFNKKKADEIDEARKFEEFKRENIEFGPNEYFSLDEIKENPPLADVYITGSDQVWNHTFTVSPEAFLLCFGSDDVKRVAYAASFGVREQDPLTKKLFIKHLRKFDKIGVRERSGIELVENLGFNPVWVLDPTMLFNSAQWNEMLNLDSLKVKMRKESIFIYTLGNSKTNDKDKFISYALKMDQYNVIHSTANSDFTGNLFPTIEEWVNYIRTSRLVITTSFHGIIFCILNNTNFIVLPNTGSAEGMNDRIESMLSILNMEDHLMIKFDKSKFDEILERRINWDFINKKIEELRIVSKSFISDFITS
ncbi:polysaccharide pyruvyl transferase family protein [Marinoscillum pacificum]|uniref:polysaccharide pyruvyl transferase family protein n=1 Tax=Marinoscillum pacificum TaxID=392723 RepID=UPI00215882AC|nr:polysaccharide pyruvyl transferase family protein [Marinoscillum pacificum]